MWDFLVSPSGNALKGYKEAWFADELSKVRHKNYNFLILKIKVVTDEHFHV